MYYLEEASTHKSAKTHAGNVFVTHELDPQINGFPGRMVEHFCANFSDTSCINFWDIVRKNRQTDTQTNYTAVEVMGS